MGSKAKRPSEFFVLDTPGESISGTFQGFFQSIYEGEARSSMLLKSPEHGLKKIGITKGIYDIIKANPKAFKPNVQVVITYLERRKLRKGPGSFKKFSVEVGGNLLSGGEFAPEQVTAEKLLEPSGKPIKGKRKKS